MKKILSTFTFLASFCIISNAQCPEQPGEIDGPDRFNSKYRDFTFVLSVPYDPLVDYYTIEHSNGTLSIIEIVDNYFFLQWPDNQNISSVEFKITPFNSCGSGPYQNKTIIIDNTCDQRNFDISGTNVICNNNLSYRYTTGSIAGNNVEWEVVGGEVLNTGGDYNHKWVDVQWTEYGQDIVIASIVNGTCTTGMSYKKVAVQALQNPPQTPTNVSGLFNVCQNRYTSYLAHSLDYDEIDEYIWSFSGGVTSYINGGEKNSAPTVLWNNIPGTYQVDVVARRCDLDSDPFSFSVTITDKISPVAPSPITGNAIVCINSTETYQVDFIDGLEYRWYETGEGYPIEGNSNVIQVNWLKTGYFNLKVRTTNDICESYFSSIVVLVEGMEQFYGETETCVDFSQYYAVRGDFAYGTQFEWDFGEGGDGTANNSSEASISWSTPGAKTISCIITYSNGCSEETATKTIEVGSRDEGSIIGEDLVCEGIEYTYSLINSLNSSAINWVVNGAIYQEIVDDYTVKVIWDSENYNNNITVHYDPEGACYWGYSNLDIINKSEAPDISCSNLVINDLTHNSISSSFIPGNGDGRMVLFNAVTPVNSVPINGVVYNPSNLFGEGDELSNGNFVVYGGSLNDFEVIGLEENTTYYYSIIEYSNYCNSSAPNYLVKNVLEGYFMTPCIAAEPTSNSTSLTYSDVRDTRMNLSWINGNGGKRLVVAKQGSAVSVSPNDGNTNYNPSNTFGNGDNLGGESFVVYNGSGNAFTLLGLSESTTYHYAIYEYNENTECYLQRNYLTSSKLTGSKSTLCSIPSQPTSNSSSLSYSDIRNTRMNLSWTSGNGTHRLVVARSGSAVSASPADGNINYNASNTFGNGYDLGNGNFIVYNGSGSSFTLLGLTGSTTYHYAIYEYNQNTGCYKDRNYRTGSKLTGSQATKCDWPGQPTTASSSFVIPKGGIMTTDNSIAISWTSGNGARRIVIARKNYGVNKVPNDGAIYNGNAAFGSGSNLGNGNYVIYNGTGNLLTVTNLTPSSTYYFAIYEFNQNNSCYVRTNYLTSSKLTGSGTTDCTNNEPTVLSSSLSMIASSSSISLNWSSGNGNKRMVIARQGSAVNKGPSDSNLDLNYYSSSTFGSGANLGNGNYVVYNGSGHSFTTYGLSSNTTYYFAIYEYHYSSTCYPRYNYSPFKRTGSRTTASPPPPPPPPGGGDDPCLQQNITYKKQLNQKNGSSSRLIKPICDISRVYGMHKTINVDFSSKITAESEIYVYDMTGKKVKYLNNCDDSETNVTMDFSDMPDYSILIVQVINAYESKSVKVLLSR